MASDVLMQSAESQIHNNWVLQIAGNSNRIVQMDKKLFMNQSPDFSSNILETWFGII